jgi:predicted TIM-barrel fold metal-dependent hydrolase
MSLYAISADSHVTEPGDCYVDRIDPRFRDRAPVAADDETMGATMEVDAGGGRIRIPYGMIAAAGRPAEKIGPFEHVGWDELHAGGWDAKARLEEQDRDGVAAEVLYPSVGMLLCNHPDADYKKACFDAYNLWMAEFQETAPQRLLGIGQTALRSVEEGIEDLARIRDLGLRGVMMPGMPSCHEEGDYDDPRWDPYWRAAIELGIPLSFHILTTGADDSLMGHKFRGPKMNSFLGIIRGCQDIIGTLIFGGVFDRHPDLRVVCVEADAGWVPHWMYRADHAMKRHRNWLGSGDLSRMPSEFFRENVYVTFQDDWVAFQTAQLMNPERLMWASDHPHSDSTFPNSQQVLAEQTAHMTPEMRDAIVWRNCAQLYGIEVD